MTSPQRRCRIRSARWGRTWAPPWTLIVLCLTATIAGGLAGLDLAASGDRSGSAILAFAEIIGARHWGWAQAVTSASILAALTFRSMLGVIIGHALAGAVWAGYSAVLAQGVIAAGGGLGDGVRFANSAFLIATVHVVLAAAYVPSLARQATQGEPR